MSLIGRLFTPRGDTIRGTLEGAGTLAKDLRSAFTGEMSAEKRAELEAKALELEVQMQTAQINLNATEAQHKSVFVAGWRPFVGWTLGAILAAHYVVLPVCRWIIMAIGADLPELPIFEIESIRSLLFGMMGMGTLRTVEKFGGVNGRH